MFFNEKLGNTKILKSTCTYFSLCCAVFVDGSAMSMGCSSGLISRRRLKYGTSQGYRKGDRK
jgi:hypothetical protein